MRSAVWSRSRHALGVALCVALLSAFIVPVQAPAFSSAIAGRVVVAGTGAPLGGLYLRLQRYSEGAGAWIQVASNYTGNDGRYGFDVSEPGSYRVQSESTWHFDATSAPVAFDGVNPRIVDLAVQPLPPAVAGSVRRADTLAPLWGALVEVYKQEGDGSWMLVDDEFTESDGTFTFSLPLGQYKIVADAAESYRSQEAIVDFTEATVHQDFLLQSAAVGVQGRVTDKTLGKSVRGAHVALYVYDPAENAWDPVPVSEALTGTDGAFALFDDWESASPLRRVVIGHDKFEGSVHEYSAEPDRTHSYSVALMPIEPVSPPSGAERVAGADRYRTAIEASRRAYPHGSKAVVIATGEDFADALGGAALAGALDAPLLLTRRLTLPSEVSGEIQRLKASRAYILGGNAAIDYDVYVEIEGALSGTTDMYRIEGKNRYETAYNIADWTIAILGSNYLGDAFVATGANFPDALAASPVAASAGVPVLLADPKAKGIAVPSGVERATITGGADVVPAAIMKSLENTLGKGKVRRVAGSDRFDTAARVAQLGVDEYYMRWNGTGVATGLNFPDALAGGAMLGRFGSVMLLTRPDSLSPSATRKLATNASHIEALFFLGGVDTVHENVRGAAQKAAGL